MTLSDAQRAIADFMAKSNQVMFSKPTLRPVIVNKLRLDLIKEETKELEEAINNEDIVEISDALGDLLYVVLGAANAYGIDITPVFKEIHVSNMTKFIDGYEDENGKWIKGPSYTPVNLLPIIQAQERFGHNLLE